MFALVDNGNLVNASALIGADKFLKVVDVEFILIGINKAVVDANFNRIGVNGDDFAWSFSENHNAGIASGFKFHTGTNERSLSFKKRNGLTLHISAHESAISVVIFEEGN